MGNSPAPNTPQNQQTIGEIDFALWSVFDPGGAIAYGTSQTCGGCNPITTTGNDGFAGPYGNEGQEGFALKYLTQAVNWVRGAGSNANQYISQFTVYYDDTSVPVTNPTGAAPPQEFLVYTPTPEPAVVALLGCDFAGVGALVFILRRRSRQRSR